MDLLHKHKSFCLVDSNCLVNTKTVEVYVIRSGNTNNTVSKSEEETYLTTCKGVPQRDLPPLNATPSYIDGTVNAKESTEEEDITFYKFVFVSPGGPKPHLRVKLKFVRSNGTSMVPIIIRTLKVKGRLSESIAASTSTNTSSNKQQSMPFGGANRNTSIPNNDMNSIASMMAMMGGNTSSSMPMQMQMNSMQQMQTHNTQQQMYTQQQQQQLHQQQDNHYQQEKNQAELISSIAGLGNVS